METKNYETKLLNEYRRGISGRILVTSETLEGVREGIEAEKDKLAIVQSPFIEDFKQTADGYMAVIGFWGCD